MIELIDSTFQILAKVTHSKTSLLLKFNNFEVSVISFAGDTPGNFSEFKKELFHLYKGSGISNHSVENLPVYKSITTDLGVHSCFIQNVYLVNELNESVYMFLFLDGKKNIIPSENDVCMSIVNILSNQLKDFYHDNFRKETLVSATAGEVDGESIIRNYEDNFNDLLKISHDLIFFLDKNGCFLKLNDSGALLLDYTEKEIVGKHFLDFVPAEQKGEIAAAISEMLHSNRVKNFFATLKSRLNVNIAFEITCRTIIRDSKVIGMLGIGHDISKLKKIEEEMQKLKPKLIEAQRLILVERGRLWQQNSLVEELDRLKSEFVSNISHEFRTPLASIIGFSETIVSDPDLPEEMKSEFNHVILNEGKRLAKLINDVLNLSNIEGGKIALNKSNLDVIDILKDVVDKNSGRAEEKNISVEFEHPKNEVLIEADREKLAQSFEALINNAIKFTNEKGRVKVIVNDLFKELEIIISDTGVGIPEKDLPYIFQKFYRVSRPGTEIPGTGIGLVFVKQIVDLHKGLISVQSESGNGTTFILKFLKSFKAKN
jgi:PAS domain S-box-containing protein